MTNFWRSFFGLNGEAGNRTVVGSPDSINVKDAHYIKDSKNRLNALQELQHRYQGTPHAQKIEEVYGRTLEIHRYLISRKKVHELELFHLQHTDHFLNTFTVIMDAYQQQIKATGNKKAGSRADAVFRKVASAAFGKDRKEVKAAQLQNSETSQRAFADITEAKIEVPRLAVPQISINTYARIVYLQETLSGGLMTNEIGFTSSPEEKEAFVDYVAERLGLDNLDYVGNAMVYVPTHTSSSHPAEMLPVIHWNGCPYVLNLEDCRLYPVRTYRKSR